MPDNIIGVSSFSTWFLIPVTYDQLHSFPPFKNFSLTDTSIYLQLNGHRLQISLPPVLQDKGEYEQCGGQAAVGSPHILKGSTEDTLHNVEVSTSYCNRVFISFLGKWLYRRFVHSSLFARKALFVALQTEALLPNNCIDIFFFALLLSCHKHINKSVRAEITDWDVSDD